MSGVQLAALVSESSIVINHNFSNKQITTNNADPDDQAALKEARSVLTVIVYISFHSFGDVCKGYSIQVSFAYDIFKAFIIRNINVKI